MEMVPFVGTKSASPNWSSLLLFWFCLSGVGFHLLGACLGLRYLCRRASRLLRRVFHWCISCRRTEEQPRQAREQEIADNGDNRRTNRNNPFGPNSLWGPDPRQETIEETFAGSSNRIPNNRGLVELVWRRMRQ